MKTPNVNHREVGYEEGLNRGIGVNEGEWRVSQFAVQVSRLVYFCFGDLARKWSERRRAMRTIQYSSESDDPTSA